MKRESAVKILSEAEKSGTESYEEHRPTPMIVQQHEDMLNDNSPVKQAWDVPEVVCGFAWINVPGNSWFIRELKKKGFARPNRRNFDSKIVFRPGYPSGYQYWVGGGQSYERKVAFARAFSEVLNKYGVKNYTGSRLD